MSFRLCKSLLAADLVEEDSGGRSAELVAAIETWNFEDEHVTHDLALELDDEVSSSLGRAAYEGRKKS